MKKCVGLMPHKRKRVCRRTAVVRRNLEKGLGWEEALNAMTL